MREFVVQAKELVLWVGKLSVREGGVGNGRYVSRIATWGKKAAGNELERQGFVAILHLVRWRDPDSVVSKIVLVHLKRIVRWLEQQLGREAERSVWQGLSCHGEKLGAALKTGS